MTQRLANRRCFLRGAGGALLATPFLSSLVEPARAESPSPRRLVIFHTSNGCLMDRWFPSVQQGAIDAAALAGTTLEQLAPFASRLLFPRGLAMYPFGSITLGGVTYFDPDQQSMGSKLTAAPIDPEGEHWALGRSLDHVAADLVNPLGNGPLVLSVGTASEDPRGIVSYTGPRGPFVPQTDPRAVFESLTGASLSDPTEDARYRLARRQSVIDVVRADLESFQRLPLSVEDRKKVSDWLELLRETELGVADGSSCSAGVLGIDEDSLDDASPSDTSSAMTLGAEMMMKLITLALVCDANRSVVLQWPAYVTFDWDGIEHDYDHAGLSHRTGSASVSGACIDGALEMLGQIDRWYAGRYASLLGLLDQFAEDGRSVLDNSAVAWIPQLSDGLAHNVNDLPIVIAGSAGGALKQGISVNVEGGVLETTESSSTCVNGEVGFPSVSQTGRVPLNKLYVTLLNALGASDGGMPITEFGQVDSNDIEAGITDPGGLADLEA